MKHILFIQGAGAGVHAEWDSKLVESLRRELGTRYEIRYPRMPNEADPTLAAWRPVLVRELASLQRGDVVVGHSVGGSMLVEVLAESPPTAALDAIVLIAAPFIGDPGWESEEIEPRSDLAERLPAGVPVFLYHGTDDDDVPVAHVQLYADALPRAHVRRLPGRDHQLNNDLSEVARDIRELESRADNRT
jgi:predicted alpha/beta hydrolase family esterase